ncbi:FAD-dependent monooxygenase [Actinokineospora sp. G85]|uniref:FAD-dependent monooxygenase n=1 Tax=Actinokineospora sp. G85 TaxID=3406626 RepID=UPI003C78C02D
MLQAEINDSDGDIEPTLATFQTLVDDACGPGAVTLREALWTSRWRYNERMVDRFRVGRVLLAGDAAHVHAPAGAQGMNTGVHDGINLGWKLASVLRGAPGLLLDTYEQERLPVAAAVLGLSKELLTRFARFEASDLDAMSGLGITYRGGPRRRVRPGPPGRPHRTPHEGRGRRHRVPGRLLRKAIPTHTIA